MRKRCFIYLVFLCFSILAGPLRADTLSCPVCGMRFKDTARTSFESVRDGKPIHVCSFQCARRLHKKLPAAPLKAIDFNSGAVIEAKSAWFLIRSKNVLKELDFDMPPSVIAFSTEEAAKKTKARLKDGEIVKGFNAVEKAYE